MATHGIKVSEDGYDVRSASEKNLSLTSNFTLLKVFDSGLVNLSAGDHTIAHNLGYVPQFFVYGPNSHYSAGEIHLSTGNGPVLEAAGSISNADTTNLYITAYEAGNYKYYIFYEQT